MISNNYNELRLNRLAALAFARSVGQFWIDGNPKIVGGRLRGLMEKLIKNCDSLIHVFPYLDKTNEAIIARKMNEFCDRSGIDKTSIHIAIMAGFSMAAIEKYFPKNDNLRAIDKILECLNLITDYFDRVKDKDCNFDDANRIADCWEE